MHQQRRRAVRARPPPDPGGCACRARRAYASPSRKSRLPRMKYDGVPRASQRLRGDRPRRRRRRTDRRRRPRPRTGRRGCTALAPRASSSMKRPNKSVIAGRSASRCRSEMNKCRHRGHSSRRCRQEPDGRRVKSPRLPPSPTVARPWPVRTRFAPSPTGYLHIGGARTALYCWLEARRRGGAVHPARRGHRPGAQHAGGDRRDPARRWQWLGLDYDEGPIYQTAAPRPLSRSRRADGRAPAPRTTPTRPKDELEAMREAAMAANEKPRYNGAYRDANAGFRDDPNRVIRFKNPARRHRRVGRQGQGPHRDRATPNSTTW